MKTTSIATSLLLTALALASLPTASAAGPDPCDLTTLGCDPVHATCTPLIVGVSCVYSVEGTSCMFVHWGIHQPGLLVGGYHTCHAAVWVDPGQFVTLDAGTAPPCDVSPTWPGGHATCTVAGRTVGCAFWTGATLLGDRDRVDCGVAGCPGSGFHFDGRPVNGGMQGCVVYVNVEPTGAQQLLDAVTVDEDGPPCTTEPEVGCSTPAGSCSVFLNRWSYGGCEMPVVSCLDSDVTAEWDRLSVHANTCGAGFHLVG